MPLKVQNNYLFQNFGEGHGSVGRGMAPSWLRLCLAPSAAWSVMPRNKMQIILS